MQSTAVQMRRYQGAAIFSFGFRPFFFGGAIAAALVPVVTASSIAGWLSVGNGIGAIVWHTHEMLYGYLAAVVAGFVLTAVPNWTGRLPVMGARLAVLFALWIAGRIVIWVAPGAIYAAVIDVLFLLAVNLLMWREIIAGRNWRNAPVCLMVALFAVGNFLWHIDVIGGGQGRFGARWGIAIIALLLALIGGRVTPSFTRNWLAKNSKLSIDAKFSLIDRIALVLTVLSMISWLAWPDMSATGVLLAAAATALMLRLLRWEGWKTSAEPLVIILHLGYWWLSVGVLALGLSILIPNVVLLSSALHALTAGAAGVMTLAVMTRATLGHTGRALIADRITVIIYLLVNLGAVLRLAAPYIPLDYTAIITVAAIAWSCAFLLFAFHYGRFLLAPRVGV